MRCAWCGGSGRTAHKLSCPVCEGTGSAPSPGAADGRREDAPWGAPVRYLTDDRDEGFPHELVIQQGGNGDWYADYKGFSASDAGVADGGP